MQYTYSDICSDYVTCVIVVAKTTMMTVRRLRIRNGSHVFRNPPTLSENGRDTVESIKHYTSHRQDVADSKLIIVKPR